MKGHSCARKLQQLSRNFGKMRFPQHAFLAPSVQHSFIHHRQFSAPTSQQSNPNMNKPVDSGLPQNIQNIMDRDAERNQSRARTPSTSTANDGKKKTFEADPKSMLPTDRQKQIQEAFDYCVEQVKNEEPQIYQCLQYLKCTDVQRLGVMVLRALHLELSRVRSDANTADAAKIRLQWWISAIRDVIEDKQAKKHFKKSPKAKIGSLTNPPSAETAQKSSAAKDPKVALFEDSVSLAGNTPVLTALAIVRRRYNLNAGWLVKFVASREHFLSSNAFLSLMELEEYSESTHGLLLSLTMEVMGAAYATPGNAAYKASAHVACCMTIASVLRSMPFAASNGFISIPEDIATDHRLWETEKEILQGKNNPALQRAVKFMCERAYAHLIEARELDKELTKPVKSMLLVATPAERYLQSLEKSNFNVFDQKLLKPDLGVGYKVALAWRAARNEF